MGEGDTETEEDRQPNKQTLAPAERERLTSGMEGRVKVGEKEG